MNDILKQAEKLHAELKTSNYAPEVMERMKFFMECYEGDDEIIHSAELRADVAALENEQRYYTGIKALDDILDGFRSNQLVVISAPPKAGKTQMCVHIARGLAPNLPTMFLFEESATEVMYKYHKRGLDLPAFWTTRSTLFRDMDDLYRKMIEAWVKFGSKIFFVDHLHYLLDSSNKATGDKIKEVMQELKEFAKRHDFCIILVAHMTKGGFTEPPGVESIRDSSFIPQYADTTIIMWRQTFQSGAREHKNVWNYSNNVLLNVALNRKINFTGDTNMGLVDLTFDPNTWEYVESDWYLEWALEGKTEETAKSDLLKALEV